MMKFVGDLSKADAELLSQYARMSNRLLEFGVGGSTMVFAQAVPEHTEIISMDTHAGWLRLTKQRLENELRVRKKVRFGLFDRTHDLSKVIPSGPFDLIFVDGLDELREPFALAGWDRLEVGGVLLLHDTRVAKWQDMVARLLVTCYNEIDVVRCNERSSNITAIVKKKRVDYVNWNDTEGRSRQEQGYGSKPLDPI